MAKFYRIKEVYLNNDGTDVWFYPQVGYDTKKTEGMWWWKKEEKFVRWKNYYDVKGKVDSFEEDLQKTSPWKWLDLKDSVIAFRDLTDAEKWIKDRIEVEKKESEIFWKNIASRSASTEKHVKVHDIKI